MFRLSKISYFVEGMSIIAHKEEGHSIDQINLRLEGEVCSEKKWISCQVGPHSLFLLDSEGYSVRLIDIDHRRGSFRVAREDTSTLYLSRSCLTSFQNRYVVMIGGREELVSQKSAILYHLDGSSLGSKLPDLNVKRCMSSACSFGDTVFVYSGFNQMEYYVSSIEFIRNPLE